MLGVEAERRSDISGKDVLEAERKRRMEAATLGFSISQERVPVDRGTLQQSGFQPEERSNGDVVFGYTAPYAKAVEEGTDPYQPPIEPLEEWGERIGKGRAFGRWVATEKIPEQGQNSQPYLEPAADRMEDWLKNHNLAEYYD